MIIEPCACSLVPCRSSHEGKPGAVLIDVTDERGRWHAVQVGERIYRQSLVAPSAAEVQAEADLVAAQGPERQANAEAEAIAAAVGHPRLAAALVIRAAGGQATAEEQTWAAGILADALARIRAARGG